MAIPIQFVYFPGPHKPTIEPKLAFHFLETETMESPHEISDSVCIRPRNFQLPWPSSFPAARQCCHWKKAQASCIELMINIRLLQAQKNKAVPKGFMLNTQAENPPVLTAKEQVIVESAVKAAAYMVPNTSPESSRLISQLYMLLWIHDDVVEYHPTHAGTTVVDEVTETLVRIVRREIPTPEEGIYATFGLTTEILDENNRVACTLIEEFASFIYFTREQIRSEFKGLSDFMVYRGMDIALDFISTSVQFGNGLGLTAEEIHPLKEVIDRANIHMTLVNDFYSYDKEHHALVTEDASILNSVHYLDTVLSSGSSLAKEIALLLILDSEARLQDSLRRLEAEPGVTRPQLRYAHGMVEAAAGNLLFSLTSVRYGRGHGMREIGHTGDCLHSA